MRFLGLAFSAIGVICMSGMARAGDVSGVWLRDTGASKIRFAPCGAALCGHLVWLKDPENTKAKVGDRIYYDMKANGENAWYGSAYNPEDGKTYTGKMALSGGTLTTKGCTLGGIICRGVTWTRVN